MPVIPNNAEVGTIMCLQLVECMKGEITPEGLEEAKVVVQRNIDRITSGETMTEESALCRMIIAFAVDFVFNTGWVVFDDLPDSGGAVN